MKQHAKDFARIIGALAITAVAVVLAGCTITSTVDEERARCVDSGRIAIVRDIGGEAVLTACLSIEELEGNP